MVSSPRGCCLSCAVGGDAHGDEDVEDALEYRKKTRTTMSLQRFYGSGKTPRRKRGSRRTHPCERRGVRPIQATASCCFFRRFSLRQKTSTVLSDFCVAKTWSDASGKKGKRKMDLTRGRSNTSGKPEDDGGGRKPRRSVAVGEENGDVAVKAELYSGRSWVEKVQRLTAKLEMVAASKLAR